MNLTRLQIMRRIRRCTAVGAWGIKLGDTWWDVPREAHDPARGIQGLEDVQRNLIRLFTDSIMQPKKGRT